MKILAFLFTIIFCFISTLTFSQVIEWQNTIGGFNNEELWSIQQTSDGGYILGGSSYSDISGDKTENSNGSGDYWIVKTDKSGLIEWQNTVGGSNLDVPFSIIQTSDGGYILGGASYSDISGDKTENSIGGSCDYWIVKTDSSGNIQWQNTIGGSSYDELRSIQQTSDGGYILGGYSTSNISGDKTENCNGFYDYWIVKTDASGTIQWENTFGGNDEDFLFSIEQTADGGFILGGRSKSNISGDKTENSNGDYDFWIIKTDVSGVTQWQNTIGGNSRDELYSIEQTTDGGYILGGHSRSNISGDKTENSTSGGDYDCWIVKTDSAGVVQWQNTIGGSDYDYTHSIDQTLDGGYVLGGSSPSNISRDKRENSNGYRDFWIIKTDASGIILSQNSIGGSGVENLYSIKQTTDGGYILGAYSNSNISGDKTENCIGAYDYWILKITDQYNLISGKLFIDSNSNNTQDTGEPFVLNKQVIESNTGRFSFSEQNGNYSITLLDSGNFSVSLAPTNYYSLSPISHSAYFTGIHQTDSLNDFALQPVGIFNDLCVAITPLSPFRAGFIASYLITYENVGTTTLNPTVIFYKDNDLSFVSASPVANSVTPDSVVWNFGPLAPFQQGSILVTVNITTGTPIGTLINSGAQIEPLAGDANTICNQSYWEVFTTGSYDPNDIIVDEDTLLTTEFPNPPHLDYIIRFQNTGNDTAFAVKVLNSLDTFKLDLNSFEFVASSHPVNINWIDWERNMQFTFENILLPDSNVNEPASHGFIRYRIKPKSMLSVNDSITNNAAIYFDFNAPIITNTAVTHIELPTLINEQAVTSDHLLLYPNPANSMLTIETDILPTIKNKFMISDVEGRTLYSKLISSSKHTVDISFLSQGIYFVEVRSEEKIARGMFVKN